MCSGNTTYDISLLVCTLCPINSVPNINGKGYFDVAIMLILYFVYDPENEYSFYFKCPIQESDVNVEMGGGLFRMLETIAAMRKVVMEDHQGPVVKGKMTSNVR